MNQTEWREFLKLYSKEFLSYDWSHTTGIHSSHGAKISDEARRAGWMGFEPASEEAISAAENRLERRLPASLRTFYSVSNGWGMTGSFIFDVLPVEKIGWLKHRDNSQDALLYKMACENETIWSASFKENPSEARWDRARLEQGTMVKRSLVISSWGDAAIWLLDPGDQPHSGEWPGGSWASWNPAMDWTAESFADLMRHELESNCDLRSGQ
jgi:hypothetical protein